MKKYVYIILLASFLFSCSTTNNNISSKYNGAQIESSPSQDGSSYEKAIVIKADTDKKGVDAEYAWIREHYPNSHFESQALDFKDKKPYDIMTIKLKNGTQKVLYFDISNCYGKM